MAEHVENDNTGGHDERQIDGCMEMVKQHCTEAIGQFEKALPRLPWGSPMTEWVSEFCRVGKEAIKFVLPDHGKLLEKPLPEMEFREIIETYMGGILRLPYPSVVLQFETDRSPGGGPVLILLSETDVGPGGILIRGCCKDAVDGTWVPFPHELLINVGGGVFGWDAKAGRPIEDFVAVDPFTKALLGLAIGFLVVITCKNVSSADVKPRVLGANHKRTRRGKVPFYSYKILVLGDTEVTTGGEGGGTHASPRVHLRRGHIRRLPDKTVWVNACVVGNKSIGMVHKDYELRAPE